MRHALFTTAAAALLLGGCGSAMPKSPVAAPMTERQAAKVADLYLDSENVGDRTITSIEPHGYGHFVSYKTEFEAADEPPRVWQVVDVRNDGHLRHVKFNSKK